MTEYCGKVNWSMVADDGTVQDCIIDEVYSVPKGTLPMRLLPPQVWVASMKAMGTDASYGGDDEQMVLHWGRHTKSLPFNTDNLAITYTAPSFRSFRAYTALVWDDDPESLRRETMLAMPAHVIPDDDEPVVHLRQEDEEVASVQHRAPVQGTRGAPNIVPPDLPPPEPPPRVPAPDTTVPTPPAEGGGDSSNVRTEPVLVEFGDDVQQVDEEPVTGGLDPQAELLRWHYRLNHASWLRLKMLALLGVIPRRLASVRPPKCAGCDFATLTKTPWRTKAPPNAAKVPTVNAPGDCVSIDQLESPVPGFIAQLKGFLTRRRYRAATVFVDHHSDLSFVHLQESTKTEPTLEAKAAFEAFARKHGVTVRHYHADNGRFAERRFIDACERAGQTTSFCGAYAHHQNGRAEKRIRDLQDKARTMLMHAKARWPRAVSTWLWPHALRTANDVRNSLPLPSTGVSPMEEFAKAKVSPKIKCHHAFGCPVFALDSRAASSKQLPKWEPRSRLGLYLGLSPKHASTVGLVLNIETGLVSPVFHASYDDFFETLRPSSGNPTVRSEWQAKAGFTKSSAPSTPASTPPAILPSAPTQGQPTEAAAVHRPSADEGPAAPPAEDPATGVSQDSGTGAAEDADEVVQGDDGSAVPAQAEVIGQEMPTPEGDEGATMVPPVVNDAASSDPSDSGPRRTSRRRKPTAKAAGNASFDRILANPAKVGSTDDARSNGEWHSFVEEDFGIAEEMDDPISFIQCCVASKSDPDTMYVDQALKAPDREQFLKAMQKEVDDHSSNEHWRIVPRSGLPSGTKVLPAVWAMKRKRRIATREVYKHKARLNLHGGKQEYGVNYWETYAPVVNWFSIRLFLVVALLLQWHARQVDFTLAYTQAEPECDMYMEVPRGFEVDEASGKLTLRLKSNPDDPRKDTGFALHLLRNLYGGKAAGRIWNQHLDAKLQDLGFVPSDIDECVYYRGSTVFLLYTDDGIILDADPAKIDSFIKEMARTGLNLEDQGAITDYLGVKVEPTPDGKLKLYQPQLIDDIIAQVGFNERTKPKATPAPSSTILSRDLDGQPFEEDWEYRSVVGKLNFLEKSTRPDIAYATHQVARFSAEPRKSHADAIKHIGRYLVGTKR